MGHLLGPALLQAPGHQGVQVLLLCQPGVRPLMPAWHMEASVDGGIPAIMLDYSRCMITKPRSAPQAQNSGTGSPSQSVPGVMGERCHVALWPPAALVPDTPQQPRWPSGGPGMDVLV